MSRFSHRHYGCRCIINHVFYIVSQMVSKQRISSSFIDNIPLFVHHIIILQQSFSDTKVILFHFFLSSLNGFRNHRMLNHISFFMPEPIHHPCDSFRPEKTHQIILQRHIELRASWVSLSACSTSQLSVYPSGIVSFCSDNCQTSSIFYLLFQFNVRTTPRHIGCDSNYPRVSCFCYNFSFFLMKFCIQHLVWYLSQTQCS